MFAIMMGISNLGSAVADGAATALSDDWGFRTVFWVLAAVNLATLPVLRALFRAAPEIAEPLKLTGLWRKWGRKR
jgi:predicted MFS family arabinose efflux permease